MSFTLQLVQEIEKAQFTATEGTKKYSIQNRTTVVKWLKKSGAFDSENQILFTISKSPEKQIIAFKPK